MGALIRSKETWVWVLLCALSVAGVSFSGRGAVTRHASGWLLVVAAIKFALIAYYYMELNEAHRLWRWLGLFFMALLFVAIGVSY